jgi:hypothetical protein
MAGLGVELELAVLLGVVILGSAGLAVFEVETPWWRKLLKWGLVVSLTLGLYAALGHWSLLFPLIAGIAGVGYHLWWCGKHGIDPVRATPRHRYYELRGWTWSE